MDAGVPCVFVEWEVAIYYSLGVFVIVCAPSADTQTVISKIAVFRLRDSSKSRSPCTDNPRVKTREMSLL